MTHPSHPIWKIALIANLKEHDSKPKPGQPPDVDADFDTIETIELLRGALQSDGHKVTFLLADPSLPAALASLRPDICFNIAEGLGGEAREAQVPALLELLGIPYTGSRVLANAIALDKDLTKRIWRSHGLPVANDQIFMTGREPLDPLLSFPLFVKPLREGTGMGVTAHSVVTTEQELREQVEKVVRLYRQPALVEELVPGREFTVGLLGRGDARRFSRFPERYDSASGHLVLPILELEHSHSVTPGVYSNDAKNQAVGDPGAPIYICPARLEPALQEQMSQLARRAHSAILARDVSRSDMRLNARGEPVLVEINPLPGLTPGHSDLCLQAAAAGIAYNDLVLEILGLAAGRWGLLPPRD